MSMSYESCFGRCDFCGKPQLPSGIMIISFGDTTESQYCTGHEEHVCCPHCGSMVLIDMHPFKACQYFHSLYDTSAWLRYDEVLKEAEAILKQARIDEKWEGAE